MKGSLSSRPSLQRKKNYIRIIFTETDNSPVCILGDDCHELPHLFLQFRVISRLASHPSFVTSAYFAIRVFPPFLAFTTLPLLHLFLLFLFFFIVSGLVNGLTYHIIKSLTHNNMELNTFNHSFSVKLSV